MRKEVKRFDRSLYPSLRLDTWAIAFLLQKVYSPALWLSVLIFIIPSLLTIYTILVHRVYTVKKLDVFKELDKAEAEIAVLKQRVSDLEKSINTQK